MRIHFRFDFRKIISVICNKDKHYRKQFIRVSQIIILVLKFFAMHGWSCNHPNNRMNVVLYIWHRDTRRLPLISTHFNIQLMYPRSWGYRITLESYTKLPIKQETQHVHVAKYLAYSYVTTCNVLSYPLGYVLQKKKN